MKFNLTSAKDLKDLAKKLTAGLNKLTIENNVDGFLVKDLQIPAGGIASVRNELTFVPSQYIITNQTGNGLVTRVSTDTDDTKEMVWNSKLLYLKNNSTNNDVTISVFFMR